MEDIESKINSVFTDEFKEVLTNSIRKAYDTVCEAHDPKKGFDAMTFGTNIYRIAKFEISQHIKNIQDNEVTVKDSLSFRFMVEGFEVACHKVGHNAKQDIRKCFPNNTGAAHELVYDNLELINQLTQESMLTHLPNDLSSARKLVLAHKGNPDDGCCSIHLCVPIGTDGKHITEWALTMPLWEISAVTDFKPIKANDLPSKHYITPEEQIPPVPLTKKKKDGEIDLQ